MRFGTDKVRLGYLSTYLELAARIGVAGRVCEVGVAGGGSLEMWQALFPDGLIVGVDNDPGARWPDGTYRVLADQDADDLPELVAAVCPVFDLIVDDASHDGPRTRRTFDLLWPLVAPGGVYVIEDWQVGFDDWPSFDRSMLDVAEGLLELVRQPECRTITYRHGQILVRRADAPVSP